MSTEVADAGPGARPATLPRTARRLTRQLPVTIVAPVRSRKLAPLRRVLERLGDDPAGNAALPLAELRSAHYARLVLLEPGRDLDGHALPAQLVFMSDIDEPLAGHLDDLLALADGLDLVFEHCVDYPARGEATRQARRRWLERHLVETQAFYTNTVGRTVEQIQRECELRTEIERFLDGATWEGYDPLELREAILDHVDADPDLAWARVPAEGPGPLDVARDVAAVALPIAGLLAAAPVLAPLLPLYALLLSRQERHDAVESARPSGAHERRLAEVEDLGPQNPFSAIGFVKQGLLRRVTIGVALQGLDVTARHVFHRGDLAGVKTIHFAHWTMLDGGRRMIFSSNYDGTVKSYNDDFIDKVWAGLNVIFSNGVGWPRTTLLIWGGARDEQAFKNFLRCHQIPTQVWYCAYPELTAVNIDDNAKLRAGLIGEMSYEEAERWLRLI